MKSCECCKDKDPAGQDLYLLTQAYYQCFHIGGNTGERREERGHVESESHLSDVEVEELHHQAVEATVVDVGQAGDEVVLGVTESVHHKPLSLQSSLVVRPRLVELQGHGRAVKDRDSTVNHTTSSLANLQQQKYSGEREREREI